jgi:hypothetical protein
MMNKSTEGTGTRVASEWIPGKHRIGTRAASGWKTGKHPSLNNDILKFSYSDKMSAQEISFACHNYFYIVLF